MSVRYPLAALLPLAFSFSAISFTTHAAQPSGSGFNPKISLILDGKFADYSRSDEPAIAGFLLGPETEPPAAGLALGESELVVESNIDDAWHGWATVALENEDGETVVGLEEAYINSLALPSGFSIKAGRFLSDIGYLNRVHAHAWDFADQPLAYRALLAKQYRDDGLQVKWVAPTDLLLEFGAEATRGSGFPGGGDDREGVNGFTLFTHLGGDIGSEGSYRLGLWGLRTDAVNRETASEETPATYHFTGDSDLYGIDAVYKWAENGNPAARNLVLQAEYLYRSEKGSLDFSGADLDGDDIEDPANSAYRGRGQGFYIQGVYQFVPRWRTGLRYDRLEADNRVANNPLGQFDQLDDRDTPQRVSLMLDYSHSEFSRVRLQYNRDQSRPGKALDNQIFLQYTVSLGSHPAHSF